MRLNKIFISSDHAGFNLKKSIIKKFSKKQKIIDIGPSSTKSVDYPDYAHKLSKKVSSNIKNIGILVCGTGTGMAISANKNKKIRAALCYNIKSAKLSRQHNNANVIAIGARLTKRKVAIICVDTFIKTEFVGGRHLRRIKKI